MSDAAQYLTSKQVRQRYGNVSAMTIWRWAHDETLRFPQPEPIRRRNFWKSEDLDSWDASRRATEPVPA